MCIRDSGNTGILCHKAFSQRIGNASRNLTEEEKAGGVAENIVAIDGIAEMCIRDRLEGQQSIFEKSEGIVRFFRNALGI